MRVAILGPLEVQDDAGRLLPLAGARLRDLVIRLALAGGKPVSTAALAEAIWDGQLPADLPNALQTLVSRARRALGGPGAVEQAAGGYRLAVAADDVDALRFERLIGDGALAEALALWRGPALQDAGEFAEPYALRLRQLKLDATLAWLGREVADGVADGRAAAHLAEIDALRIAHPLDEKVTALLMRALAASGRQAEALDAYEKLRGRLAEELGIDPGAELRSAHLTVLRGEAQTAPRAAATPTPAPAEGNGHVVRTNLRAQLTSFVGRADDVAMVERVLAGSRLVTLVGPGGAGKTRLASEVAAQFAGAAADGHPGAATDGVWLAELAPVTDGADVPQAVLGSIGLRESRLLPDGSQRIATRDARSRLLEGLSDASALLVLDNCEHLIDACAHLADALLAHSPRLRIVATSREPLGITGESLFVVPPLARDPAVRLFAERAAAVRPGFTVDEENLPLVTDIVTRLDGLPLAIELAAARLRTLPLAEISRRLSDRFRLLTGGSRTALPRHRTLWAVVEWSWELLSPAERLLAERFSVFPGGATPAAVAAVCGSPGKDTSPVKDTSPGEDTSASEDTDEMISSLVDKSLLQPYGDGSRLRMLETIREYGAEKLAGRGELDAVRRRHAEYYTDFMIGAGPKLLTRDQLAPLRAAQDDKDNILAALRYWCESADAGHAIALALWVSALDTLLGNHADIVEWIAEAVAVPGDADPDLRTIAEVMYQVTQTMLMGHSGLPGGGQDLGDLADRVEELDIRSFPFAGLLRPAYALFRSRDTDRMHRYTAEALASDDPWVVAATWLVRAAYAENVGDMDALRDASVQALRRFRVLGERWGLSSALRILGGIKLIDGDLDGAAAAYAESNSVLAEMGSRDDESHVLLRLADIAGRRGDLAAAEEFFAAAGRAAESSGALSDIAVVSAGSAMFAIATGKTELARDRNAVARQSLSRLGTGHPARQHMIAIVAASSLFVAVADGDLTRAGECARQAYQAAVASQDMPLAASIAGSLAYYASRRGEPERAARMLGACAPVRGAEDATDLMLSRLGDELRATLGTERYDRAYARGKALDRAEALRLLDPATLAAAPDQARLP